MQKQKKKKVRAFTLDIKVSEQLDKVASSLGISRSQLCNDILKDSLGAFESLFKDTKNLTIGGAMQFLTDKIKELENDIKKHQKQRD